MTGPLWGELDTRRRYAMLRLMGLSIPRAEELQRIAWGNLPAWLRKKMSRIQRLVPVPDNLTDELEAKFGTCGSD